MLMWFCECGKTFKYESEFMEMAEHEEWYNGHNIVLEERNKRNEKTYKEHA